MDKFYKIKIAGSFFEVRVLDPTHVSLKLVGGITGTGWTYHVEQLGPETVKQLQDLGVMDERHYVHDI